MGCFVHFAEANIRDILLCAETRNIVTDKKNLVLECMLLI